MFEIEYQLTIEDDLNNFHSTQEYIANLPLIYWQNSYILPLTLLLCNLPNLWQCLTKDIPFYDNFQGLSIFSTILNFVFVLLLLPQISAKFTNKFVNWLPKYKIKKYWKENPHSIKKRKLTVTQHNFIFVKNKEFLFLEEIETNSFQWIELKFFLDGKLGFILGFPKEKLFFIPKRIFTNAKELTTFKDILTKHGQKIKN